MGDRIDHNVISKSLFCEARNLAEKSGIPEPITERVASFLLNRMVSKAGGMGSMEIPIAINAKEVRAAGEALVFSGESSYMTWLHRDVLNSLLFRLNTNGIVRSPYLNNPVRMKRRLIVAPDRSILLQLDNIQLLGDSLATLRVERPESSTFYLTDLLCSFVASAIYNGKVLIPAIYRHLQALRWRDILLSYPALEIRLTTSSVDKDAAVYRYFLPFLTANYLFRLLLFSFKFDRAGKQRHRLDQCRVFEPFQNLLHNMPFHFAKWTRRRLEELGAEPSGDLTLDTFRQGAMILALFTGSRNESQGALPPFLLAAMAQKLRCTSAVELPFAPAQSGSNETNSPHRRNWVNHSDSLSLLGSAVRQIKDSISTLLKTERTSGKKSGMKDRRSLADSIAEISVSAAPILTDAECENLNVLVQWAKMLLLGRRIALKTIDNYVRDGAKLVLSLRGDFCLSLIPKENLSLILRNIILEARSPALKRGLSSLLSFVAATVRCKDNGDMPRLSTKEFNTNQHCHTAHVVHPQQVRKALDALGLFYFRHLGRYGRDSYEGLYRKAARKAEVIFHLINLCFFGGMRRLEVCNLKINNIIYDGGLVAAIRRTKTSHGVRNLPLHLLMPSDYLEEFSRYLSARRRDAKTMDDLLFPSSKGTVWDMNYLSTEVARLFDSVGAGHITPHDLRHSFAGWFPLRWYILFHEDAPREAPLVANELFDRDMLDKLLLIFPHEARTSGTSYPHVLHVLARLIGHGGPAVTMEKYVHTLDWLFYLISQQEGAKGVPLTSGQLEDFLQLSYSSLPDVLKSRKPKVLTYETLLEYQRQLLQRRICRSKLKC